ncbi:unnamed protein product [Moneuplotes crassus]|uniref:B box-type domain-containing protein n=1 Tax=Euplotes crassus TaxID=5936 RepID=A0AAD1XAV7_EUPCR|nr:unnamed protein product [Moneuplotes crassus]
MSSHTSITQERLNECSSVGCASQKKYYCGNCNQGLCFDCVDHLHSTCYSSEKVLEIPNSSILKSQLMNITNVFEFCSDLQNTSCVSPIHDFSKRLLALSEQWDKLRNEIQVTIKDEDTLSKTSGISEFENILQSKNYENKCREFMNTLKTSSLYQDLAVTLLNHSIKNLSSPDSSSPNILNCTTPFIIPTLKSEISTLQSSLLDLKKTKTKLSLSQSELKLAYNKAHKLKEEIEAMHLRNRILSDEVSELKKNVDALEQAKGNLQRDVEGLIMQNLELKREDKEVNEEIEQIREEKEWLKSEIQDLKKDNQDLEQTLRLVTQAADDQENVNLENQEEQWEGIQRLVKQKNIKIDELKAFVGKVGKIELKVDEHS